MGPSSTQYHYNDLDTSPPVITLTWPGLRKSTTRLLIFMQWHTVAGELIDSKSSGNKMDMVLNDWSSRSFEWKAEKACGFADPLSYSKH